MNILGISAYYHDSAACLIQDGKIIAAAQEERFTRKKHDARFPTSAIAYCLKEAGITTNELNYVAFYEKPFLKFERILEVFLAYAPRGISTFLKAMPVWLKKKLWMKNLIMDELNYKGKIIFTEHHESHAASAFFPSPFEKSAFLTMDGVGEFATTSYGLGDGNKIKILAELDFPHSLGMLYSAFTYYAGFRVNSGEYKVMGLAPYGKPRYADLIMKTLVDVKKDGSLHLNMKYFNYTVGSTMTNEEFDRLFEGPPRRPESPLTQKEMDLASSIQEVTNRVVLKMAQYVRRETGQQNLVLAGGVALNCVTNGHLFRAKIFDNIWIQPSAGDAGGALGAALFVWYQYLENERKTDKVHDFMRGAYLGPQFSPEELKKYLEDNQIPFKKLDASIFSEKIAELINAGMVIGWFQGRMEFGPRALGARSILGDARSSKMQELMNVKIKFRESFRPFAPAILKEKVSDYFELNRESPYMLLVANVIKNRRRKVTGGEQKLFGIQKLNIIRSDIPAVTHIDYSARVQTVDRETNPLYHSVLSALDRKYGCPVMINTSFNVRGEPIVCTPEDAYRCFMRTDMDYLALGPYLIDKEKQKKMERNSDWGHEFKLD
ncbi:MAG TPA: carbamoyltransferase [Candidatus Paceibacterota bacterium]